MFLALRTQWRVVGGGMGPPVFQGIDYASIPAVLQLLGIPRAQRGEAFNDLRIMEAAAVNVLNAKVREKNDDG